jgi:hypothetical protein
LVGCHGDKYDKLGNLKIFVLQLLGENKFCKKVQRCAAQVVTTVTIILKPNPNL